MGKLDGKVAIVTGASRGIGKAIAERFAQEGARVICAARTLHEGDHPLEGSLESTVAGIRQSGGVAEAVTCNVAEEEDCIRLVEETRRIFGPCDILVNNAALTYFIPVRDFPTNKWKRSVDVNFHAPFILSKLVIPEMAARHEGAILNISSPAAIGPGRGPYRNGNALHGGTLYGAEKAALERFTQGLAEEVYADGISVTCLSPSLVVPTPGTVFHHLVQSIDDPQGEPVSMMADASLLLVTQPLDTITGRVCYSQQILQEFGWIPKGRGVGVDLPGSGYSQM
ncbi:MAG: SDR family NAD(P)-dependent oxidoreductase [Firmicutes bacterium]|nr:SDR family NAD(P)-dependent oxidoreductase [Bacillota bacterium]